uniref:Copia protein n=1 Tax=Physcomitrium patens TaxID=3218 RepID=A0A2K1IH46_PHYPA|nr:hypothetical protein PHYPA_029182 [Physcomitrium patens]
MHSRTKHIELWHHYIRKKIHKQSIEVEFIPSEYQ